jgi:hypothetical protein
MNSSASAYQELESACQQKRQLQAQVTSLRAEHDAADEFVNKLEAKFGQEVMRRLCSPHVKKAKKDVGTSFYLPIACLSVGGVEAALRLPLLSHPSVHPSVHPSICLSICRSNSHRLHSSTNPATPRPPIRPHLCPPMHH